MTTTPTAFPQYQLSQKLCALQIAEIHAGRWGELGMHTVTFVEKDYAPIQLVESFITQYNPKPGGYLIGQNNEFSMYMEQECFEQMFLKAAAPTNTTHLQPPWEALGEPLYEVESLPFLRTTVDNLWSLLDSISKMSALHYSDDKLFRAGCERLLRNRAQDISSDGARLYVVKR